jgi:hypothetical protein
MATDRNGRRSRRLGILAACICSVAVIGLSPASSSGRPALLATAHPRCVPVFHGAPCKAPIQTLCNYNGLCSSKGLPNPPGPPVKATAGATSVVGRVYETYPDPGYDEVTKRTFTWYSAASVEIVAVYVVHQGIRTQSYQKVATGTHSGRGVLTDVKGLNPTLLLLQGRRIGASSSRAPMPPPANYANSASSTHCYVREVPCLGKIQTLYGFTGKAGGAVRSIHAKLGTEEEVGTAPNGIPLLRRSFTWASVAGVRIVAAYALTITDEHGKGHWDIERLPTGMHSGHATLTTKPEDKAEPNPFLLLEGRKVG